LIPPDSALKAAAHPLIGGGDSVKERVEFKSGSRWNLTVNAMNKFGLIITGASFQKSPREPFTYVLHDGRLAEIFVPYHSGDPRYRDISFFDSFTPKKLEGPAFPAGGPREVIGSDKFICREKREYLAWMNGDGRNPPLVRYGEEVVYYAVLGAAYYAYIMEWTFRDDGTILVRAGSTGPKKDAKPLPGPSTPSEGHMHNFTWRLDIDLNGAGANTAFWKSHLENRTVSPSTATDNMEEIQVEKGLVWNPEQFNTLEIRDARLKNGNGRPTSYELIPMRTGTARHTEPWTQADFWVTQYQPAQILAVKPDGRQSLPDYIVPAKPTSKKDLVIWYTASEHHENDSRDEDRYTVPVLWTGFELDPQNLWDLTPFYPCTGVGCG
jgi:primary-amine oxidase